MARRISGKMAGLLLVGGLAMPAVADEFDLPPVLDEAPPPAAAAAPATPEPAAEVAAADAPAGEMPPDIPATPEGEMPPDLPGDMAEAPVVEGEAADTPEVVVTGAPAAATSSTLTLEGRMAQIESRDGDEVLSFRASAHWMGRYRINDALSMRYNLRVRASKAEGVPFAPDDNIRLDVQELALSWQATPKLSFDIGRINLRNGVAHGFNPTDWFKADSLVYSDSLDPADRRDERLGTLLVMGSTEVGQTLLRFGYRPEINASEDSVLAHRDVIGLGLTRTNPSEAWFLRVTPPTGDNIALTGSLLVEDGDPGVGFEISGTLGNHLVLYAEGMVQKRYSLAAEALGDAGLGSAAWRNAVGADDDKEWLSQLAVGGSWALPESIVGARDMVLVLEYHYNQAGLSSDQNDALRAALGADRGAAGAVRAFAANQQEPLARSQLFTRFAWNDFWKEADFSAIGFYALEDDSGLVQLSAEFPLNDNSEVSLRASRSFGNETTIYGANPSRSTVQVAYSYTF